MELWLCLVCLEHTPATWARSGDAKLTREELTDLWVGNQVHILEFQEGALNLTSVCQEKHRHSKDSIAPSSALKEGEEGVEATAVSV